MHCAYYSRRYERQKNSRLALIIYKFTAYHFNYEKTSKIKILLRNGCLIFINYSYPKSSFWVRVGLEIFSPRLIQKSLRFRQFVSIKLVVSASCRSKTPSQIECILRNVLTRVCHFSFRERVWEWLRNWQKIQIEWLRQQFWHFERVSETEA